MPPYYDSMVGKLIAYGDDRESAKARMRTALQEIIIDGIDTNIALHQRLLEEAVFIGGGADINYLERLLV